MMATPTLYGHWQITAANNLLYVHLSTYTSEPKGGGVAHSVYAAYYY